MKITTEQTFTEHLHGDPIQPNYIRQVKDASYSYVNPTPPQNPKIIHISEDLAEEMGLSQADITSQMFFDVVAGKATYPNTQPWAMCYGGHQFGHWAGQLGDGRAINLFEQIHDEKRFTWQLKGAGVTPYSRSADGLAVLRSSIREHLCSEAMHYLRVPTTRSLSLSLSGNDVLRDMMYDGNSAYEQGAIVCRVAPSFIRFGNFQIHAARGEQERLKALVDYTITHFHPAYSLDKEGYLGFFKEVCARTLDMVVHWQRVGFVHGVMNTDNMSILGLTIDYGPYGWLDDYDPNFTPNTTDRQHRRYRYSQQPNMALWNLVQLANAIYSLVEDAQALEQILESYAPAFVKKYRNMMADKLGINNANDDDLDLIKSLEKCLTLSETDYTIFFRELMKINQSQSPEEALNLLEYAFYTPDEIVGDIKSEWLSWIKSYQKRIMDIEPIARLSLMKRNNPKYILRNYMTYEAIEKTEKGDYTMVEELYQMSKNPYADNEAYDKYYAKRPESARQKIGCSMLSCSS